MQNMSAVRGDLFSTWEEIHRGLTLTDRLRYLKGRDDITKSDMIEYGKWRRGDQSLPKWVIRFMQVEVISYICTSGESELLLRALFTDKETRIRLNSEGKSDNEK